MKNRIEKVFLKRRINNLEYQKRLNESSLLIYESILTNRRNKKLDRLRKNIDNELYFYEVNSLSNNDYLNLYTSDLLEKLDKKSYWSKRAIDQKYKRKSKNNSSELLNEKKALEIKALDEKIKLEKEKVLQKFTRNYDEVTISKSVDLYNDKVNQSSLKLIEFENSLLETDKVKITNLDKKLQKKNDIIKQKLSKNYKALELLVNSSSSKDQMSPESILKVENLTMQFGGLKAVDSLDFEVKKGEIFGLIGPNGAGKTTVFNCITQFYKPSHGNIYFRDSLNEIINLNEVKVHNVIKHGIVRTFQNVELIWELTVLENMLVGAHSLYKTGFFAHSFHTLRYKHEEKILKMRARKILEDLGLLIFQDVYPIGLPYGILKKIELARTLMSNPSLIILDEPAAGLNDAETITLSETIKKIQKDYNCTIFLVEHDMGLVMNICDTICAISFGKKLAIGNPSKIQKDANVQTAYLGGE